MNQEQSAETPETFATIDGAAQSRSGRELSINNNRKAGVVGARALALMNNPDEVAMNPEVMSQFGLSNQGMQFNQAKMGRNGTTTVDIMLPAVLTAAPLLGKAAGFAKGLIGLAGPAKSAAAASGMLKGAAAKRFAGTKLAQLAGKGKAAAKQFTPNELKNIELIKKDYGIDLGKQPRK